MNNITQADSMHAKRVYNNFEIKFFGEYHDLYLKSNTLLLAGVFENFTKICLEVHQLHPAKFLLARGLAWPAALEKSKVEFELLTDIDMLLMVKKRIRRLMYHSINRYTKLIET